MLYKNTFTYKLDNLCQDIRLYLKDKKVVYLSLKMTLC